MIRFRGKVWIHLDKNWQKDKKTTVTEFVVLVAWIEKHRQQEKKGQSS